MGSRQDIEAEEAGPTVGRDVRVDQIGYVAQLVKAHADDLKTQVKLRMVANSLDRCRGDLFEGLLVQGQTSTVDAAQLVELYSARKITREQLASCLTVNKEKAGAFLSRDQLAAISSPPAAANPQLRVSIIKGVVCPPADALAGIRL
jgi:hypothetical protein